MSDESVPYKRGSLPGEVAKRSAVAFAMLQRHQLSGSRESQDLGEAYFMTLCTWETGQKVPSFPLMLAPRSTYMCPAISYMNS